MFNKEKFVPESKKEEISEDDRMSQEFITLVKEKNFLAEEIREAYFKLCGITDHKVTERVAQLSEKMTEMADAKYPINRFATLIGDFDTVEQGEVRYLELVESLDMSREEKTTLRSILDKRRSGKLEFYIQGNSTPISTLTLEINKDVLKSHLGYILYKDLSDTLSRVPNGKKIEISFEEK